MELVIGQIERELRAGAKWWIVSYRGTELMAFETLAMAHEWRRTTPLYVHYAARTGVQYYMQEDATWYVLTVGSRGWRQAAQPDWVERTVYEMTQRYKKRMVALGARGM